VPVYQPQISHGLKGDRTLAFPMRSLRLT